MDAQSKVKHTSELPRVLVQAARCDQCEDMVCMGGCPAHIDALSVLAYFVQGAKKSSPPRDASATEFGARGVADTFN
jgi:ferredoxin